MKFYQELPRHTKDLLEKSTNNKRGYFFDPTEFVREVKMLYKIRKAQEPEILEFESLMGGPKEDIDPYGETIDITSLNKDKNDVKGDSFTEGLSYEDMIKNLLDHGTPFPLSKSDKMMVDDSDDKTFEDED
jgi:hypothetical protein